ncbi:hypothetical protein [Paenarthrobacter sp. CM16]|uniref:hypothetical protein n=1 Tax=Paenarthrobacter sp. CM16 TaxID=2738447 RepID=UPI0020A6459C|nr:hypothetical protein [Paenarthrobacter sp. CM16]
MTNPREENTAGEAIEDVIVPQDDALPNPDRSGHGKMPEDVDDDTYQRAAEQERVAAGLADYAPSDVPTPPIPCPRKHPTRRTWHSAVCWTPRTTPRKKTAKESLSGRPGHHVASPNDFR